LKRKGFTLIEMLIIIAIIAILAAILFPVFAKARDASKRNEQTNPVAIGVVVSTESIGDDDSPKFLVRLKTDSGEVIGLITTNTSTYGSIVKDERYSITYHENWSGENEIDKAQKENSF